MDRDKKKSLSRAKKTTLSLGDILTKAKLSAVDPSLGVVYELVKLLGHHGRKWYQDRSEERLFEFHQKVFEGIIDEDEREKILSNNFSADDYYSIWNFVVQDEEEVKIEFYAKIFRAIVLDKVSIKIKAHILKSARELNWNQFELMREICLIGSYGYFTETQVKEYLYNLLIKDPNDDPILFHDVQQLIRLGFLFEHQPGKVPPNYPQKTMLLNEMVNIVFREEQLSLEEAQRVMKRA